MSHLTGSMFGIGTPGIYSMPQYAWGVSPGGSQGFGAQPFSQQQFPQQQQQQFPQQQYGQPFSNPFVGGGQPGTGMMQPLQQIAQLLQIVPQQLQQVQQLQQQQLAHLQQLLQLVPAQLQQLQQFLQTIPQQGQQIQQPWQQPGAGASGPLGFGLAPQAFGGQATGHVM
jgi:hypothetical protein